MGPFILDRHPTTLKFKCPWKPNSYALQQGARGHASRRQDARINTKAGWATNPKTLCKALYNLALLSRASGLI